MDPDLDYILLCAERDNAHAAYMAEVKAAPPVRERTPEQQAVIDRLDSIQRKASQKVWHYGIL